MSDNVESNISRFYSIMLKYICKNFKKRHDNDHNIEYS
jgi:hypothetical protein